MIPWNLSNQAKLAGCGVDGTRIGNPCNWMFNAHINKNAIEIYYVYNTIVDVTERWSVIVIIAFPWWRVEILSLSTNTATNGDNSVIIKFRSATSDNGIMIIKRSFWLTYYYITIILLPILPFSSTRFWIRHMITTNRSAVIFKSTWFFNVDVTNCCWVCVFNRTTQIRSPDRRVPGGDCLASVVLTEKINLRSLKNFICLRWQHCSNRVGGAAGDVQPSYINLFISTYPFQFVQTEIPTRNTAEYGMVMGRKTARARVYFFDHSQFLTFLTMCDFNLDYFN